MTTEQYEKAQELYKEQELTETLLTTLSWANPVISYLYEPASSFEKKYLNTVRLNDTPFLKSLNKLLIAETKKRLDEIKQELLAL